MTALQNPKNTVFARAPPRSPAISTSAHAVPSGYGSWPCSLTMSARRIGTIINTPITPPAAARVTICRRLKYSLAPPLAMNRKAGVVNTTPAAIDSPAEPMVCTMLFSRMVDLPNRLKTAIASTAMGIEADTVRPARNAR